MYLVKTLMFDSAMKLRRLYQACVFTFTFNGVTHNQCTLVKCTIIIISTIINKVHCTIIIISNITNQS